MSKSVVAIGLGILMTGLIAGLLFGVGVKTGISPDEGSIALMIMSSFCQATQGIDGAMAFNCWGYLAILTVVIALVGIAEIYATAEKIGDWKIGLGIYGFGWLIGLMIIVAG